MAILGTHNPYALAFGILGNIISFLVFLAPVPTFHRIYKKKSTEGFQSLPYLVALFSSVLWLYYAFLKKDAVLLISINSVGCAVEIIYIVMFIIYAPRVARNLTIRLLMAMNVGSFTLIVLVTQFAIHGSHRVKVLGWICVSISVSVFAAPLSIMAQVIHTKSVEFMPLSLSFFLTLSAVMWFAYGVFLKDICIAIPNVVGFVLGLLQMLLYGIYRNGGAKKEQALEPMRNVDVVVMNTLGTREVFPIPVIYDVNEHGKDGAEDNDVNEHGKDGAEDNKKSVEQNECVV